MENAEIIVKKEIIKDTEKRKANNKKLFILRKLTIVAVILSLLGLGSGLFLLYGPYPNFREWLITTAMTTMNHQYLATWFYSDDTIAEVLSKNRVEEVTGETDTSKINGTIKDTYENEFEEAILKRDKSNNDYKIIKISEKKYEGYLVAVYDASRIQTVVTKKLNNSGQYVTAMVQENGGIIGINGGNFWDPGYTSTGGIPLGITISNGKFVTSEEYCANVVGFDKDNKLIISEKGKMSVQKAKQLGLRDAVTCLGPRLITNGKQSQLFGNGGWGKAPRTAIGQRQDGVVLFLVIDGRTTSRPGADMNDLIEIMTRYGAYNAVNLDGGTSSALVVRNSKNEAKLVNDPIDSAGKHKTRPIPTAFILKNDGSNNGDHSVVDSKLE